MIWTGLTGRAGNRRRHLTCLRPGERPATDGGAEYVEVFMVSPWTAGKPSLASPYRLRFSPARTSVCERSAAPMPVKGIGDISASPCESCLILFYYGP